MRRSRSALRIASGSAVAGTFVLVQAASGQDTTEPAGLRLVIDYTAGIEVDTNEPLDDPSPGTSAALVNDLDFAILSNTRTQSFALTFGGELTYGSDPEDEEESGFALEWQEPEYRLQYSREAANARLGASAYRLQREVDTIEPFFIDLDGDTVIDETGFEEVDGTLTETGATVTLETRIDAPISTTYTGSYQARTFSDTDNPELYDRVEYRFATRTRLRFSDVSIGRVNLGLRQYEYSGGRNLEGETLTASFGLARELSPILTVDLEIGYSKNREEETIDNIAFVEENHGPNFTAQLTRGVINGSYFVTYDRGLVEDTFRNTLTFGRDISMQNYTLNASFGLTALDGEEPAPTAALLYARDLPNGRFRASFRRTVTLDTEDEERSLTSAAAEYSHEINETSSFSLGFDYALVASPGGEQTENDESRATFSATYTRALTRDWNMTVGYRGRSKSTETEDAFSNAVFVNLGRQFIFRP